MTEKACRTHHPHRSILVRWDSAGNLGQLSTRDEHSGEVRSRFLLWTEDNRLHTVVDDRHHNYYAYDHAGGSCGSRVQSQACLSYAEMQQRRRSQRTMKVTGHSPQLDVNADLMHTAAGLDEFTLYPSPYLVFTNRGYTKHYYAGTERLAARIGGGFDRPVVGEDPGLSQQTTSLFEQCRNETARRVLEAPPPHTIRRDHLPENIYMAMTREFEAPMHLEANVVIKSNDLISTAQNIVAGNAEPDVYFYHSDHLGSASWITDGDGKPVQHLQYLPYGEPFVNQRAAGSTYSERFRFTGKERDEETGFGYFGARYMDHELMTMWLSVDPLSDKYPSISPYAYCAWNPIRLVDPDGREIGDFVNENGDVIGSDGKNDGKKYLLKMVRPTPRKTDSEADNSLFGISADKRKETEEFIRNNTGNESAFTDDCIAYENSILISTTKDEFAEMRSLCKDENNALFKHEIGGLKCTDGNIYGGNDGTAPGIAIGTETNIQIKRNRELSYRYWFHLHLDDRSKYQMPSPADLKTFPDLIGYTISFRDKRIYVTTGGRCEGYITFGGTTKF